MEKVGKYAFIAGLIICVLAGFGLDMNWVPWVLAIPFYGLELLIGAIQAFIFAGLTLVFITMAATPHDTESH